MPTLSVSNRCDQIIAKFILLDHPFYVAWNAGTLPVAALKDYAREYGSFIGAIGQGWSTIGEPTAAQIEDEHAHLWDRTFAAALQTSVSPPHSAEVETLLEVSRELFSDRVSALGALYAFEAQQPRTAQSKLKGLNEHYSHLPAACGDYFRIHTDDDYEQSLLAEKLNDLTAADRERALTACDRMSRALYDALTGIHRPYVD